MKTSKVATILYLLILLLISWSCQKEVQIDLNTAAPQIVIEGHVSDLPIQYFVSLTQTVNYYNSDSFPPVNGATVKISDDAGNSETLTETDTLHGFYFTKSFHSGVPGRTYTLTVLANGKEYKAVSTMPKPVKIDSLGIEVITRSRGGNPFGGSNPNREIDTTYRVNINFRDPAGENNYYRFVEMNYRNGILFNSISVSSDRFRDGQEIQRGMAIDSSLQTINGDSITIEMQSIDKDTYDFFRTFRSALGRGGLGFLSASPSNPISNISDGAMGYFSAYSTNRKSVLITNP